MRTPALWVACGLALGCVPGRAEPPVRHFVAVSPVLHIDQKYRSMAGPGAESSFQIEPERHELLWLTAYRTEVVDAAGAPREELREFMCHNNLDFDAQGHRARFGLKRDVHFGRMFTTSQGQFSIELPPGFGIPVLSDEPLRLGTMVLNHNLDDADLDVRHRISIDFVRDSEGGAGLKPLYPTYASVLALVAGPDGVYGVDRPSHDQTASSCQPGEVAPQAPQHTRLEGDGHGRVFTPHWVVPPGEEERRTLVTARLNLPFDTRVHFIAAHMHPFARSLELRDLSSGESVWRAEAVGPDRGIGLERVDAFASEAGIPLQRDHEYEMVSVYANDSGVDQDAMATFFVYYRDLEMEQALGALRQQLAAEASGSLQAGPRAR